MRGGYVDNLAMIFIIFLISIFNFLMYRKMIYMARFGGLGTGQFEILLFHPNGYRQKKAFHCDAA